MEVSDEAVVVVVVENVEGDKEVGMGEVIESMEGAATAAAAAAKAEEEEEEADAEKEASGKSEESDSSKLGDVGNPEG